MVNELEENKEVVESGSSCTVTRIAMGQHDLPYNSIQMRVCSVEAAARGQFNGFLDPKRAQAQMM